MNSITEIESAIQALPQQEIRQLADWLQDYLEEQWDRQIESDAVAGKLDDLISRAESEIKAGRVKRLDEVIHNG